MCSLPALLPFAARLFSNQVTFESAVESTRCKSMTCQAPGGLGAKCEQHFSKGTSQSRRAFFDPEKSLATSMPKADLKIGKCD
jgi:hypothetical protein